MYLLTLFGVFAAAFADVDQDLIDVLPEAVAFLNSKQTEPGLKRLF